MKKLVTIMVLTAVALVFLAPAIDTPALASGGPAVKDTSKMSKKELEEYKLAQEEHASTVVKRFYGGGYLLIVVIFMIIVLKLKVNELDRLREMEGEDEGS